MRLEAFAQIARAVGGETELERVLALILEQGRARSWPATSACPGVCLARGRYGWLAGSLAGEVMRSGRPLRASAKTAPSGLAQLLAGASSALLVALHFRGETLGVLAAIDRVDGHASQTTTSSCCVGRGERGDRRGDRAQRRRRAAAAQPGGGRAGARTVGARAARRDAAGACRRAHGARRRAGARRPDSLRRAAETDRTSASRRAACAT